MSDDIAALLAADWAACPAAQQRAGFVSGQWTVKGTRIPVEAIVSNFNSGHSAEDMATRMFPGLPLELARDIIKYASERRARG